MSVTRHLITWGWPLYLGWWTGAAGVSWTHPAFWLLMIPAVLLSTACLYYMDKAKNPGGQR